MKVYTTLLIATLFISLNAFSATKADITMPDTMTLKGKKLVLNGQGIRKATWIKIKVYVGGLYLSKKVTTGKEVLDGTYPKFIDMHFVRSVGKDKLIGGWNDAFKNAKVDTEKFSTQISAFNSYMENIEKGEKILISFFKEGVLVKFKENTKEMIKGTGFSRALLSIWFVNPADEGLRDGLLGKPE